MAVHGASFSPPFFHYLRIYFPDFENKTGINIVFDVGTFPVYSQRVDLELSMHGSTYDVIPLTCVYQGRWIDVGWVSELDEFAEDPKFTPADWDLSDFVAQNSGPQEPYLWLRGQGRGNDLLGGACRFP